MKSVTLWILGLAVSAAMAAPARAQTQSFTAAEALCRDSLYSDMHLLTSTMLAEMSRCHRLRMLDRGVAVGVDCNVVANAPRQKGVARYEAHLRDRVHNNCGNVGTPAAMGYPSTCPAPCASVPIADFDDVAECAICLARNAAQRMMTDAYHTPLVSGPSDEVQCQNRVGDALVSSTRQRIRQQRVCQEIQDLGRTAFDVNDTTDCQVADVNGKVQRAEARASHTLAGCESTAVANLQTCGGTVAELQECTRNSTRRSVDELYNFVYPNLDDPAPLQAFATSGTFSGRGLGDVSGANAICQNAAITAGLTGTFTAWISTHSGGVPISSPSTTFVSGGRGYERVDGTLIANDLADLLDGTLLASLSVDELGGTIDIDLQNVWTGTQANGTPYIAGGASEGSDNCELWSATGEGGVYGRAHQTDSTWTHEADELCSETFRLYCFEQAN